MALQERSVVLGFRFAWATFGLVPKSLLHLGADLVADRATSKNGVGVRRLRFNISRVLQLSVDDSKSIEITKLAMRSYMRYWVDMFAMTRKSNSYILDNTKMVNATEIESALSAKQGVVVAVTHSGNWDLAGAFVALKFGSITTVAERLRPVELFDEFTKHRELRNLNILPHKGGKVPPSIALAEVLREGKLIGLVSDRDMSHHGTEVEFFGHKSKMPLGAAKLAIENNALLIPAAVYEDLGKTVIEFYPSLDLKSGDEQLVTQSLAKVFETIISTHPENWHMLQRIWLDMPKSLEDAS
jgi:KDO2-lipid IV(A) lauroyltransferase